MVNVQKLKGLMAENNLTGIEVARAIKCTPKTFYTKMKTGSFNSDEMALMIPLLKINDPAAIFFADFVAQKETSVAQAGE